MDSFDGQVGTHSVLGRSLKFILGRFDFASLMFLGAVILAMVALHVVTGALLPKIPIYLNIASDRSIPEYFCYVMDAAAIILLVRLFRSEHLPLFLSFAFVFLLMMLDDSFEVHEELGHRISYANPSFSLFGLEGQASGELIVYLGLAIASLATLLLGAWRTPADEWPRFAMLAVLIGLVAVFAVGVDLVHDPVCIALGEPGFCNQIFDLLEDGGEMVAIALILAHTVWMWKSSRRASLSATGASRP